LQTGTHQDFGRKKGKGKSDHSSSNKAQQKGGPKRETIFAESDYVNVETHKVTMKGGRAKKQRPDSGEGRNSTEESHRRRENAGNQADRVIVHGDTDRKKGNRRLKKCAVSRRTSDAHRKEKTDLCRKARPLWPVLYRCNNACIRGKKKKKAGKRAIPKGRKDIQSVQSADGKEARTTGRDAKRAPTSPGQASPLG